MKGTITVEVAYIMPVVFLVFVMTIMTTFYFHDKCIIHGVAYEAGIIGARHYEDPEGMEMSEVAASLVACNQNKCILFSYLSLDMKLQGEQLEVVASASKGRYSVSTSRMISLVHQEKVVRNYHKIESVVKGTME